MIRLKDLPDDFVTNPGQFDHAATSDAVAALAMTIKDVVGSVEVTIMPRGNSDNCTKIVFSKGNRHVRRVFPDFMERNNNYYQCRREFLRALEELK